MELHIHLGPTTDDNRVIIDDLDITKLVMRSGFSIVMTDDDHPRPLVTMQMRANTVTVDGTEVNINLRPPEGVDADDPVQVDAWLTSLRELVTKHAAAAIAGGAA